MPGTFPGISDTLALKEWLKRAASRVGFRSARRLRATEAGTPLGGQLVHARHSNRSGSLDYTVYIPARDARLPRPLVVMLHGCKQDSGDFAAGTRMNEYADELGFIVAYPEQAF